jgi:4-hydroxy-2-oxoheptanedioate aldolase
MTISSRSTERKIAYGMTLTIADPFVAEVIASQPLDFLMIDSEHSPVSPFQVQTQLIALRTSSAELLVRVPHLDPVAIMQVLDMGADGVVVPQVESADDARAVVRAAFYPPEGDRGVGPRRAARLTSRAGYYATANSRIAVIIMIESATGVGNLDEILAVPGIGGVIIGNADLAASLGHLGEPNHPDVVKAVDVIFAGCNAADVPFGMYAASASEASSLASRGARIVTVGSDLLFLEQGMSRVIASLDSVRDWVLHGAPDGTAARESQSTSTSRSAS